MIHLRLIVPSGLTTSVLGHLRAEPGVAHVIHLPGVAVDPPGDVVLCDVVRESADGLVEWLQDADIHHTGAITIEPADTVVSDAAARADEAVPGYGTDALIWEQVEARARDESVATISFLLFMTIAAVIAVVGILLDSPILIVGAMVVGPEYGPLASMCVGLARRRLGPAALAARALLVGLAFAGAAALIATLLFQATGLAPDRYDVSDRELTAFISEPDGLAAVVAVLAGIAGMLALTEARSGVLVGVLVSVTTIPAIANVGAAASYGEWDEVGGAAAQLALNLTGLLVAGVATLLVQHRLTAARRPTARRA